MGAQVLTRALNAKLPLLVVAAPFTHSYGMYLIINHLYIICYVRSSSAMQAEDLLRNSVGLLRNFPNPATYVGAFHYVRSR